MRAQLRRRIAPVGAGQSLFRYGAPARGLEGKMRKEYNAPDSEGFISEENQDQSARQGKVRSGPGCFSRFFGCLGVTLVIVILLAFLGASK